MRTSCQAAFRDAHYIPLPRKNSTQRRDRSSTKVGKFVRSDGVLEREYTLAVEQLLSFERKGHILLRSFLPQTSVEQLHTAIQPLVQQRELAALQHRVRVLCPGVNAQSLRSSAAAVSVLQRQAEDAVGFLQFFNLHR